MPFDITDSRVDNVLGEIDNISAEDVEEVTRERRNYMVFLGGQSSRQFLGISLRERSFDSGEFKKVVNTEIKELV